MFKSVLFFLILSIATNQKLEAQGNIVSEDEALKIAKEIQTSINNQDGSVLKVFFDMPSFFEKIKQQSTAAKNDDLFTGFKSTFNMNTFASQVAANVSDGGYQLVHVYASDGKRHLLFRLFGKSGLNYHDYSLIKRDGVVKADDVYVYVSGEDMSTTVAVLVDVSMSGTTDLNQISEELNTLLKLKEYQKNKDYNSIIKLFESSEAKYKKNNAFQIIYIGACHQQDLQKYKAALENYAVTFPDAPNTYLLMLDLYFLSKEYEKGIAAVDKLDSLVRGDTFLDFYRGNLYLALKEPLKAKLCYDNVFKSFPVLSYVIKNVVILHMNDNEAEAAKSALNIYKVTKGFKQQYVDDIYLLYPQLKD